MVGAFIICKSEVRNLKLKEVSTKELVEELKKREGVDTKIAEPYSDAVIYLCGPATVLVVID